MDERVRQQIFSKHCALLHSQHLIEVVQLILVEPQPDWTDAKKLGYLRPLLYRNFDFYLFVLRQARENYGKDDTEFYETDLAPTWLTSITSLCRSITRSEWESSQVSQDLRSQVLFALHQSKPVRFSSCLPFRSSSSERYLHPRSSRL